MRIEPKQAFYNDATGAVQPWKDIEVTDAVGNTLVAEGLVTEIEGGGGGGLTPYTVTVAYGDYGTPAYFHGGIGYDESMGTQLESVIRIDDAYYAEPSNQLAAGTYEILPLYEGGAGYFNCSNETAATVTGDAAIIYDEIYESYYVKVTGDCSITFTE